MAVDSKIEWTDSTWNPVTGCTQISPGCDNCYAKAIAERFRGGTGWPVGFDVQLRPNRLRDPLKWKEPRRIFVNSMSDLFHRGIPPSYLGQVFDVMLEADQHTYQILTKRPHRMAWELNERYRGPLPQHIWLGTSVENQEFADNRIPALLECDAPVKFLSCEPLLGPLDLTPWLDQLQWVITGGESGANRAYADPDWFRSIRDQCLEAGVPYFHKQGNHQFPGRDRELDGRTWDEMPGRETVNG